MARLANYLARLVFPQTTRCFSLEVDLITELTVIDPFDFFLEDYAQSFPFEYPAALRRDRALYLEILETGPGLTEWVKGLPQRDKSVIDLLVNINGEALRNVQYVVRMQPGVQDCDETLNLGKGSCRDSAWLLVQTLRHLGFAARFVSAYLIQLTQDQASLDGPSGASEDFTDLHAWAEVCLPGAGWVGLDATSGLFAGEGHIPLACTPEPASAAPVEGGTSECEVEFYYHNRIRRVHEDPRVTAPFTDSQWQRIFALGETVDQKLNEDDVRLTMGGEPTFVAIENTEAEEWNTGALGEHKSQHAELLTRRLFNQLPPGCLLPYGQGKWYPGEPLPRWANSIFRRADGVILLGYPRAARRSQSRLRSWR